MAAKHRKEMKRGLAVQQAGGGGPGSELVQKLFLLGRSGGGNLPPATDSQVINSTTYAWQPGALPLYPLVDRVAMECKYLSKGGAMLDRYENRHGFRSEGTVRRPMT